MSRKMVVVFIILLLTIDFLAKAASIQRTAEDVDDSAQLLRVKRRGKGGGGGSYRTRTRVYMPKGRGGMGVMGSMGGKSNTLNTILGIKTAVLVGLLIKNTLGGGVPGGGKAATDYPIVTNVTPPNFLPPILRKRRKRSGGGCSHSFE